MSTPFKPAESAGIPVASRATVQFSLDQKKMKSGKGDKMTAASEEGYTIAEPAAGDRPKTISHSPAGHEAVNLPKPTYPPAARAVRAEGAVGIQVLIDETGNVFSARAVSGHPLLRSSAVIAACSARFEPTLLSGEPVKVSGMITYNFVR